MDQAATGKQIRDAYQARLKEYDLESLTGYEEAPFLVRKLRDEIHACLVDAYRTLLNEQTRKEYDRFLRDSSASHPIPFEQFMREHPANEGGGSSRGKASEGRGGAQAGSASPRMDPAKPAAKPGAERTATSRQGQEDAPLHEPASGSLSSTEKILLLTRQGDAAYQKQDYRTAVDYYSQLLDLNPEDGDVLFKMAQCYLAMPQKALDAERYIRKAIAVSRETNPHYLFLLGKIQEKEGLWGLAKITYEKVRALDNEYPEVKKRLMETILKLK